MEYMSDEDPEDYFMSSERWNEVIYFVHQLSMEIDPLKDYLYFENDRKLHRDQIERYDV